MVFVLLPIHSYNHVIKLVSNYRLVFNNHLFYHVVFHLQLLHPIHQHYLLIIINLIIIRLIFEIHLIYFLTHQCILVKHCLIILKIIIQ